MSYLEWASRLAELENQRIEKAHEIAHLVIEGKGEAAKVVGAEYLALSEEMKIHRAKVPA